MKWVATFGKALGLPLLAGMVSSIVLLGLISNASDKVNQENTGISSSPKIVDTALILETYLWLSKGKPEHEDPIVFRPNRYDANYKPSKDNPAIQGVSGDVVSLHDDTWAKALKWWQGPCGQYCRSGSGDGDDSGLQCAAFVESVWVVAHELNKTPDAGDSFRTFQNDGGSMYYSAVDNIAQKTKGSENFTTHDARKELPLPGDLVSLSNPGSPGHAAVVVDVVPPSDAKSTGYIAIAQANARGTFVLPNATFAPHITNSLYNGTPIAYLTVTGTEGNYRASIGWNGYDVVGYVRDSRLLVQASGNMGTNGGFGMSDSQLMAYMEGLIGKSSNFEKYGPLTIAAAKEYGLPPLFFLRQIQLESSFNPKSVSSADAVGIAQIIAAYHNKTCTNAIGGGSMSDGAFRSKLLDDPAYALRCGAYLMMLDWKRYQKTEKDPLVAYAMATAAYNGGQGAIDTGNSDSKQNDCYWLRCLAWHVAADNSYGVTYAYVLRIMGTAMADIFQSWESSHLDKRWKDLGGHQVYDAKKHTFCTVIQYKWCGSSDSQAYADKWCPCII